VRANVIRISSPVKILRLIADYGRYGNALLLTVTEMSTIQNRPEQAPERASTGKVDHLGDQHHRRDLTSMAASSGAPGDEQVSGAPGDDQVAAAGGRRVSIGTHTGTDTLLAAAWFTRPIGRALIEHGAPIRG
jgi:hypothetical protein